MKKVNWGILSTANIGVKKVIPGMQKAENIHIKAIASREIGKAKKVAKDLNIPIYYGSYEELLADEKIDAVYIPLPNHLHVEWSIKCLKAGKHVLCEKPIGLDHSQAELLLKESHKHPELKIMEAFMYRFHPQWAIAKKWIEDGAIGDLVTIDSIFTYYNDDPGNVRNMKEIGGGGLMDIGCYNISISRYITEKEPDNVRATLEYDPDFGTDRLASGVMNFGDVTASFTFGTQLAPYQRTHIFGRSGRIEIEIPFNAPPDMPCCLWLNNGDGEEEVKTEIVDQYRAQGQAFSDAILNNTPAPTPLEDAVNNMRVIDMIRNDSESLQLRN
jgi:predicted dehydrogenase